MMNRLKDECERVLAELNSLPEETLYLGFPIIDDRMEEFERKIGLSIADDFKYLLKKYNGFSVMGTEVIGFKTDEFGESISSIYEFEHFKAAHKMTPGFLPFSPDGRGITIA